MKPIRLASLLLATLTSPVGAQVSDAPLVKVQLQNTSSSARTITLVTYQPSDPLNGTEQVTVLPGATKELVYRAGTKIYLATPAQVTRVMRGERIDQAKPFLLLKRSDAGKTFRL